MSITKDQADNIFRIARELEETGRLCSLSRGKERSEFQKKYHVARAALLDSLNSLRATPFDTVNALQATPVMLGDKRFQFDSYAQWVSKANSWFISADLSSRNAICLDAKGRICDIGRDFKAADADGAYPVTVYEKRPS